MSWAVKALVEATPISGPALVVIVPLARRGDGGADDVADGEGLGALGDELVLGGDGVGGLAPDWVMRRPMAWGSAMGSR